MQRLQVFQSMWAMERRHTDGIEPSLDDSLARILAAGFDGVSAFYRTRAEARDVFNRLRGTGLRIEGLAFPRSVEDLRAPLEHAAEFPVVHLNVQPDVRPPHRRAMRAADRRLVSPGRRGRCDDPD